MNFSSLDSDSDIETPIDHNFHQQPNDKISKWESSLPPEYWEYRRKWEEYPQSQKTGAFPIHLDIEATSACNLKCVMCARTDMIANGSFWKIQPFDFDAYARLVHEGVQQGLASIKFNFLGEPTLNPRLIEMIKLAKEAGVVDVMFNTNATLLNEKLSRRLIESGLDKLFFSFDSGDRDSYNGIRVGAEFEEVLTNIRRFMDIRNAMGSVKPFTRVSMVLMKQNRDEWEAFRKLFEPIVDAVAYVDYLDHSSHGDTGRTVVPIGSRKKKFCCPQLWQRMAIHPDGVVSVCCIDSAREIQVGNIFENTAQEIWLGKEYERLRELHASGNYDQIPTCAKCPLAQY